MLKDILKKTMSIVTEETKKVGTKLAESIEDLKERNHESEERIVSETERKQESIENLKKSNEILQINDIYSDKNMRFEGTVNMAYFNKINEILERLITEYDKNSNSLEIDSFDETSGKEKLLFHNKDYSFSITGWAMTKTYGNIHNEDERIEITNKENNKIWLNYGSHKKLIYCTSNYEYVKSMLFGLNEDCISCLKMINTNSQYDTWYHVFNRIGVRYLYNNYEELQKILKNRYNEQKKEEIRQIHEQFEKKQREKKETQDKAFNSFY